MIYKTLICSVLLFWFSSSAQLATAQEAVEVSSGVASFYNASLHGLPTASGEKYNHAQHTAAHRSLPFGTRVRVTHINSGRSVVVRINDRGPFIRGRIIDVSGAAAKELGIVRKGIARVQIEVIDGQTSDDL